MAGESAIRESDRTAMRWNLDSIFPGGSESKQFREFRHQLKDNLGKTTRMFAGLPATLDRPSRSLYKNAILDFQRLAAELELADSFATCLISQDVDDREALHAMQEVDVLSAELENIVTRLEALARAQTDAEWAALLDDQDLFPIRFYLNELREKSRHKMQEEFESFANELAVNGYHAWNRLYDKMAGDLRVEFEEEGRIEKISLGQLASKLDSPSRPIRKQAFEKLEDTWESRADYAALALNSLAGYRLTLYRRRDWKSTLYEPLAVGRLKQETLDAMWGAVANAVTRLVPYIEAKKRLLGIEKFMWYDQTAPVGMSDRKVTFEEARKFITKHLAGFSNEIADFSIMALDKRWIEAENRPGKAGGGYCTRFGPVKESRIFMTYLDTFGDLVTLAHELGHSYHGWALRDLPQLAAKYPLGLAETASIFNELLVTDAALEAAESRDERLMMLDQKLQRAHIMFCNIHARYLFDRSFYEERKAGVVSRSRLDQLMVAAQKQAFGDTLDPSGYHPLFWASKLHFFLTSVPFYNFPYTFGLLFAGGVYDRAKKEGRSFAPKYRDLLRDTGSMTTEEIGMKHLGVDLTKDDFWQAAVERMLADVEPFVKLAGEKG
jgi:pepF/M3 family oligoendopeptidase